MSQENEIEERRRDALKYALGEHILDALSDPDVVEVMLNDDGRLWVESLGKMRSVGVIRADDALAILNQVSTALDGQISKQNPIVSGELPLAGERFEGIAPPVVERAIFAIRKKSTRIFTLNDYVRTGTISFAQSEVLRTSIKHRENILVVGGTGSGKTTFCNALLDEKSLIHPGCRELILEDTRELQCSLANKNFLRANEWSDMARLSLSVNRLRPDSITVGEVRAGAAALALLKLWNTGHPGGMATIHANDAYSGLTRLDQLIQEVSANPQCTLIGEAVNIAVFLKRTPDGRKVQEIIRVKNYDPLALKFEVESIV